MISYSCHEPEDTLPWISQTFPLREHRGRRFHWMQAPSCWSTQFRVPCRFLRAGFRQDSIRTNYAKRLSQLLTRGSAAH